MPLPSGVGIPLHGYSRPGDIVHSKPKQAMIVRMSAETFDALQSFPNQPQMDFEFGENPRIYIGDAFFPMRPLKEDTPHELYLRASSATKKNPDLKLYANVTGKFTVERELGDLVKDKLRETTMDAAKQKDRKTKFIDTPPDLPTHVKKRKDPTTSSMFRNVVRPTDLPKPHVSSLASTALARATSPLPPKQTQKETSTVRKHLVHCIALSERTREQVIKMVGGTDCDSSLRREILELLDELAEPSTPSKKGEDQASKTWRLKPESWLQVRPYEWPKLTESERVAIARTARQKLDSLRIPESDPAWSHVKYRSTVNSTVPSVQSSSRSNAGSHTEGIKTSVDSYEAPKRGVTSKEVKERRTKQRPDPKAEIQMKDESARAGHKIGTIGGQKEQLAALPLPSNPATLARKLPGSGFRAKSTSQDGRSDTAEASNINHLPRTKAIEPRTMDRSSSSTSSRSHISPQERKMGTVAQPQRIKKTRELDGGHVGTDSEREKPQRKERDIKGRDVMEDKDALPLKRKKASDNDYHNTSASHSAPQKKRKTGSGPSHSLPSTTREPKLDEPQLPSQRERPTIPRPKIKKEHPPSTTSPPKTSRHSITSPRESSPSTQGRKMNGISKARRRSPVYTSTSEDEGDKQDLVPLPTPPMATDHSLHLSSHIRTRAREARPLPTDHAALRAMYSSFYVEYLSVFQKMVVQKGKLDSMLTRNDIGSSGSITDSDGDVELMDPEELTKLTKDHDRLKDKLTAILDAFK